MFYEAYIGVLVSRASVLGFSSLNVCLLQMQLSNIGTYYHWNLLPLEPTAIVHITIWVHHYLVVVPLPLTCSICYLPLVLKMFRFYSGHNYVLC